MFKERLTLENILIKDCVADWKEAINESVQLLEDSGAVPSDYKEKVIQSIEELGPYIFIAPEIAIPHVQYFGKTDVGISLLKVNETVSYDADHEARLFFAFSAKDSKSHMELIQELAIFLSDEKNVNAILKLETEHEIYDFIQREG